MKRLISLISSEEKTEKQLTKEVWQAVQKFKRVEKKIKKDLKIREQE